MLLRLPPQPPSRSDGGDHRSQSQQTTFCDSVHAFYNPIVFHRFPGLLTAASFHGITLGMPENQKAVAYVRAPETRGQNRVYDEKFSGFLQSIAEAKANGIENLVISSPWIIGDTYEEILESLSRLAGSGIALHVVGR